MTISLTNPPGFADVADSSLAAERYALGILVSKISDNAEFGVVRMEVFEGVYSHGQTVDLPVSPIDGYSYERDELLYIWTVKGSVNPSTGWITGPDCLWYCNWYIDQTTGVVTSVEWYRRSGSNDNAAQSNDGNLQVFTIAQRQKATMHLAAIPYFADIPDATFYQDKALNTGLLTTMNNNAKFSCVNSEVIYMGEFVNGDTVGLPVSPVDGYVYAYDECSFLPCWKWTTINSAFTQPPKANGQLATLKCGVNSSTGAVSVSVAMVTDATVIGGSTLVTHTDYGRVAVFAVCDRAINKAQLTVQSTSIPWDPSLPANSSLLFDVTEGGDPDVHTAPILSPFALVPGISVTVSYISGTCKWDFSSASTDANGNVGGMAGHSNFPSGRTTGPTIGVMGLIGAFTNGAGAVIGTPFNIGNGPVTKTVPTGASRLQLGVNDDNYYGNSGSFLIQVIVNTFTTYGVGDDFAEIDQSEFYPGVVLKASDVLQINKNARQGALSPEIFGPSTHSNGDTIALPVSSIDGYTYARSELNYLWTWTDTTNQTGSHLRMPLFHGVIDPTTGVVTLNVWRLPPGGPIEDDDNALARISVIIVASRQRVAATSTGGAVNAPTDTSTIPVDLPASGYVLVDGS